MRVHIVACAELIVPSILAVVDDTILHACATFRANRHRAERARRTFVHAATNRDIGGILTPAVHGCALLRRVLTHHVMYGRTV